MRTMNKISKFVSFSTHFLLIPLIFALAVFASLLFAFWHAYPSGFDAPSHVFRTSFIAQFWPHINWTPVWAQGMPLFVRYPPLAFIILGLFSRWTAFTPAQLVAGMAVFAIGLGGVGIYLFVHQLTRTKLVSLAGAILYLFTPATWMTAGRAGGYPRAYATPLMILALWTTTVVLDDLIKKKKRYWPYFLTIIFLGLCVLTHPLIGFFAFSLAGLWILASVRMIKIKSLIFILIKIFIPAVLIASALWLPVLALRTPRNELPVASLDLAKLKGISWQQIFNFYDPEQQVTIHDTIKLTPFLYPLAIILGLSAILLRKGKMAINSLLGRAVILLMLVSILALFFLRIVSPLFKVLYAGLLGHLMMLNLAAIFVAILVGLLIFYCFRRNWLVVLFSILIIGGMLVWVGYQFQFPQRGWRGLRAFPYKEDRYTLVERFIDNPQDFNYRWGTSTDAGLGAWLNIAYPFIPQTRDYSALTIVNIDDDVYKTHVVWLQAENYPETEFIFDWFAINKFLTTSLDEEIEGKYEAKPELFEFLDLNVLGHTTNKIFEYIYPSPILSLTDAPTALVISKDAYDVIYRSFAQGNINSRYLIPVVSKKTIDDYQIEELKNFDIIILYNYMFKDRKQAFALLDEYVRQGGGLFIESNVYVEEEGRLPEPFPVNSIRKQSFADNWNLTVSSEFEEIDLVSFSPPVYQEGPWGGVIGGELKDWAQVLVSRRGEPLIVGGQLGRGRVVWSGMNLPYHALHNHNPEEARFMAKLLAWTKGKDGFEQFRIIGEAKKDLTYESEGFTARFVNPEEFRIIPKNSFKGALFKEFYFPDWQARVLLENGQSRSLPLYQAGPKMMYALVPAETKEIIFSYHLPKSAILGRLLALMTLFFLLGWPLFRKLPFAFPRRRIDRFKLRITGWWERDEI